MRPLRHEKDEVEAVAFPGCWIGDPIARSLIPCPVVVSVRTNAPEDSLSSRDFNLVLGETQVVENCFAGRDAVAAAHLGDLLDFAIVRAAAPFAAQRIGQALAADPMVVGVHLMAQGISGREEQGRA